MSFVRILITLLITFCLTEIVSQVYNGKCELCNMWSLNKILLVNMEQVENLTNELNVCLVSLKFIWKLTEW